ncbi:MAG: hypothetical protein WCK27_30755 [Verrucomicrobiota bacterium]
MKNAERREVGFTAGGRGGLGLGYGPADFGLDAQAREQLGFDVPLGGLYVGGSAGKPIQQPWRTQPRRSTAS